MPPVRRTFQVNAGVMASEPPASSADGTLYASPEELLALYGCAVSEEKIRAIHSLIEAHCCRPTLWPYEYEHQLSIPADRQETRLPVTPVIHILAASGRYGYGRRDRQGYNHVYGNYNALLVLAGAARPQWTSIDTSAIECDAATGQIYLPYSTLILPYSMVRVKYQAGYIEIPARVKMAIVEIANTMGQKGSGERTRYSVGRVSQSFAGNSFLSADAKQLLEPFVVHSLV